MRQRTGRRPELLTPRAARGRRGDDGGASAVELAIIAPTLLLLIFFVIQGALYFYGRSVALQAAREGVSQLRLAQTRAAYDSRWDGIKTNVENYAGNVGSGALTDAVASRPADKAPDYNAKTTFVTVRVTGNTISLIPGFTLSVSEQASGTVERFEGDTP